ncbi:universal stress protein [Plebeiibacterium sediminum]|uniref:Universal stress protein n=1 Tax=Plebeiibacterium sediminum TaxID=2992112 RepID=A0AAE3M6G1_9BACT|nr:universal stress protein [Plebeiobacterium sediminum]MCW3787999.1 universal stress protein [Plebeiobacterium sediminum]
MTKILVPIDFSENSLNALEFGIQIANKLNAELKILHVKTKKIAYRYSKTESELILSDNVAEWLHEIVEKNKEKYTVPGGRFDYKVREGNIIKEVTNQAKYDDTTLIVIGTHGASGFEDKWIGSNAYRLVHSATVPVLTIRPERKWRSINNIVLPISINRSSRQKVPAVVGLAKLFNAKIYVVGIKEPGYSLLRSRVSGFVKQTVRFINKNTELRVESIVLSGKSKAELLLEYIDKVDADVIATNILQTANPFENLIKPFANQLINESRCPVLAVPTKESLYLQSKY